MLQHYGLDVFQHLMSVSIVNRASCYRSGLLSFLLGWFSIEDSDDVNWKIAQLIKLIGGYSISGKDIRKIFALLRCEKVSLRPKCCSLLLSSVQAMLKDKGSTAFLDFSGVDSVSLLFTFFYHNGKIFFKKSILSKTSLKLTKQELILIKE